MHNLGRAPWCFWGADCASGALWSLCSSRWCLLSTDTCHTPKHAVRGSSRLSLQRLFQAVSFPFSVKKLRLGEGMEAARSHRVRVEWSRTPRLVCPFQSWSFMSYARSPRSSIFSIINTSESFVNKNNRGTISLGPEE